jgi:hypothetical protein
MAAARVPLPPTALSFKQGKAPFFMERKVVAGSEGIPRRRAWNDRRELSSEWHFFPLSFRTEVRNL